MSAKLGIRAGSILSHVPIWRWKLLDYEREPDNVVFPLESDVTILVIEVDLNGYSTHVMFIGQLTYLVNYDA